jgi:hypothetical protein
VNEANPPGPCDYQINQEHRLMAKDEFRPMKAHEYRDAIEQLGLNQLEAARMLHIGQRTSRRYAAGEVPALAAMLLRVMLAYEITPEQLEQLNRKKP